MKSLTVSTTAPKASQMPSTARAPAAVAHLATFAFFNHRASGLKWLRLQDAGRSAHAL